MNTDDLSALPEAGHDFGAVDISVHPDAEIVYLKNCLEYAGLIHLKRGQAELLFA